MATLTGHLVADTYKALLKLIDNDIVTATEKQISDGLGGGTNVFIDQNGFLRAKKYKVTDGTSSQFLKADGSLDSTAYLPVGTTTTNIPEGTNLYFTTNRVLNTLLTGFVSTEGTVTASDTILSAINKIWWNIENGGGGGGGYVPYTGATQNLNLGTYGLISDYVQFNTTNSSIPTTAGTMSWNDQDGTADLKLKGGNVTLQIGQEQVLRVVNKTGATLAEADFRAVRIRSVAEGGAQGQRLAVVLAQGDNDPDSATTIGLVTENILNNEEGFITTSGEVKKIDTTGAKSYGGLETWVDGDVLYLSPTHPGYLTKVKPQAPDHTIIVGWVVYAHANNGKIFVKVDNGYELDELHNVKITAPVANDDFLMYDETESVWINKDLHGVEGYLPYYGVANVFEQSPIFTDASQVIIGSDTEFATGNKLSVVGNLAVDTNYGYHLGTYQILFRYNATGEFRIGTNAANDFTTFYANGIERMRLNASGYLGIGLTSPTQPLHVKGVLAYPKIIIDNNSTSGGGAFSAYQNGTETANFGISGAWLLDSSSDVAIVATRAGKGIQFYTNGSTSEKMGINSDGNVFIGQTPTFVAGATQLIVRGKTGAGYVGVNHYDMSIKGSMNTFNSVFQVGTSTFHSVAIIVEDIERARFNSSGRMLLGTTTDNTVDIFQANGSIIATAIKKTGGTSAQYLMADGSVSLGNAGTVTSVAATVPTGFAISGSPITTSGTLAITFASGYSLPTTIKQSNWDDAYTWVAGFPSQTGNSGKFLTTDGSTLSWSNVVLGVTSFNTRTGAITLLSADVTGALGYTPVPTTRTLSINGTSYDLSADRSWTISAGSNSRNVSTFTATAGQTTFTITGGYTPNLVDVYVNGARLNANDYVATSGTSVVLNIGVVVNDIVEIVNYVASSVASITGTGTSGYVPKWTGSSVLANSLIYDNGTNVGIGTASPSYKLDVSGTARITGQLSLINNNIIYSDAVTGHTYHQFNRNTATGWEQMIMWSTGGTPKWYIGLQNNTSDGFSIYGAAVGSNAITILANNNIAIGGSTAPQKVTITASAYPILGFNIGSTAQGYIGSLNGGGIAINSQIAQPLMFFTSDTERMRIASGGVVSINRTAALNSGTYQSQKLVVTGGIAINSDAADGTARLTLLGDSSTGEGIMDWGGNGNFNMRFTNNGNTRMLIHQFGAIRIGKLAYTDAIFRSLYIGGRPYDTGYSIINMNPITTDFNGGFDVGVFENGTSGSQYYWIGDNRNGERMRINSSGQLLINTASDAYGDGSKLLSYSYGKAASFLNLDGGGGYCAVVMRRTASNGGLTEHYVGSTYAGGISVSGSSSSYNTSSDYRLKEDLKPIKGLEKLSKINVYDFKWKDSDDRMDGVLAHELQEILPYAVTGIKDGEQIQGVDYSKIVPVLVQAIKELNAKLEAK
jgi:hypothetical protein